MDLRQKSMWQPTEKTPTSPLCSLKIAQNGRLIVELPNIQLSSSPVSYSLFLNSKKLNSWQEPYSEFIKKRGFYLSRQGFPLDAQGKVEVQLKQKKQLIGYFRAQVHAQKYLKDSSGYFENNPRDKLLILGYEPNSASLAANFSDHLGFHLYHRYHNSPAYLALGNSTHALLEQQQQQQLEGLAAPVIKLHLQQNRFDSERILLWNSLTSQLANFKIPQHFLTEDNTPHSIKVELSAFSHQPWFLALGKEEELFIARQEPGKQGSIAQSAAFPLILYAIIEGHVVHSRLLKKLPTENILLSAKANLIPQFQLAFNKPQPNKDMLFSLNNRALERPMWWFDNRLNLQRKTTVVYKPPPQIVNLAIKIRAYDSWGNNLTRSFLLPITQKNISWENNNSHYLIGETAPLYQFHAQLDSTQEQERASSQFLWTLFKLNEFEQASALDKNMNILEQAAPLFRGGINEPLELHFTTAGRYRLHVQLENAAAHAQNKNSYQATFLVNHPPQDLCIKGSSSFFADEESIFVAQIANFKEQEKDGDTLHYKWLLDGQELKDAGFSSQQEEKLLFLKRSIELKDKNSWTLQLSLSDGVYPALSAQHRFTVKTYETAVEIESPSPPFFQDREYHFFARVTRSNNQATDECSYVWQVSRDHAIIDEIAKEQLSYSFSNSGIHKLKLEVECPYTKKIDKELSLKVKAIVKKISIQKLETGSPNIIKLHALLEKQEQQRDHNLQYFWYIKKTGEKEQLLDSHSLPEGMQLQDNELLWNYQGQQKLTAEIRLEVNNVNLSRLSSEKISITLLARQLPQPAEPWQLFRQLRNKDYLLDYKKQLALPLNSQDIFFIQFFDPQERVSQLVLEEQTSVKILSQLPTKLSCGAANSQGWRRSQTFSLSLAKAGQTFLSFAAFSSTKSPLKPLKFHIRSARAVHNITLTTLYKKIALQNDPAGEASSLPAGSLVDIEVLSNDTDGIVYEYRFSSASKALFFTHARKKAYLALNNQGQAKSQEALHSSYILNKNLAKESKLSFSVSAHYHDGSQLQKRQFYLKVPSWSWSSSVSVNNKKLNVGRIYQLTGWQNHIFAASEQGLLELEFHESLGQLNLDRKKLWFANRHVSATDVLGKDLFLVTKDPISVGFFHQEQRVENMQQVHSLASLTGTVTKLYAFRHSSGARLLLMLYQTKNQTPCKLLLYEVKKDLRLRLAAGVNFPQGHEALAAAHYGDRIFVALHGKGVSSWKIDEHYDLRNAQHYDESVLDARTQDILVMGNTLFVATWSGLYGAEIVADQSLQFSAVNSNYGQHLVALFSDGESLFVQNYRQYSTVNSRMYSLLQRLTFPQLTLQEKTFPDDFNVSGSIRLSMYHWQGRYIFTNYDHVSNTWSQKMSSCENFAQCQEKPHPESEDFQALNLAWLHPLP